MSPKKLTDKQVCLRAAEILERDGWCQQALKNKQNGARCLVGALAAAAGVRVKSLGEKGAAQWNEDNVYSGEPGRIAGLLDGFREVDEAVDWNDFDTRTQEEVVALLRKGPRKK